MFEEFPKWVYRGLIGTLVADADAQAALGDGYTDAPVESPSLVADADPAPVPAGKPSGKKGGG